MTDITLTGPASACKSAHIAPPFFPTENIDPEWVSVPPRLSSVAPRISPDELEAVVTELADLGDRLTLGDLASAICASRNPVAMTRAIADAGHMSLEVGSFGDAHLNVRRARR